MLLCVFGLQAAHRHMQKLEMARLQAELVAQRKAAMGAQGEAEDREIPQGKIVLVDTDVESSTALWEWDPKIMASSLTVHDTVLRKVLEDTGGIELLTEGRLGAQVAELPLDHPLLRWERLGGGLGEAKVDELHLSLTADQYVRRAHIAVDNMERLTGRVDAVVRVTQPTTHLGGDKNRLRDRDLKLPLSALFEEHLEVDPVDPLHHNEICVARASNVEGLDDIRVIQ